MWGFLNYCHPQNDVTEGMLPEATGHIRAQWGQMASVSQFLCQQRSTQQGFVRDVAAALRVQLSRASNGQPLRQQTISAGNLERFQLCQKTQRAPPSVPDSPADPSSKGGLMLLALWSRMCSLWQQPPRAHRQQVRPSTKAHCGTDASKAAVTGTSPRVISLELNPPTNLGPFPPNQPHRKTRFLSFSREFGGEENG